MVYQHILAFVFLLGVALGYPQQRQARGFSNSEYYEPSPSIPAKHIPILRMEVTNNGEGPYQYSYETGNNIAQQETGDGTKAQGSYAYTAPDGQQVSMSYVADADGFRPQGSHMPVAPPMPEAIKRSVEQNLADEARGIIDDGQYREYQDNLPAPNLPLKYRV